MATWIDRLYGKSPVWIQNLGIAAYGWQRKRRRLGAEFERLWREYAERESWDADKMREYVRSQLRAQLLRAYREVPFYRRGFDACGVNEDRLRRLSPADLPELPLLEKAQVRAAPESLLTERAARRPPGSYSTSGTTGTPLRVFWDPATHSHNIAVREARSLHWAGVSMRDSRAVIGGRMIVPKALARPPFWRYNPWERQLYLSAFHISRENAPHYVAALDRYRPDLLNGYASGIFFLARFIAELGLVVHSPKAIITESERLEPQMRAVIEAAFRTRAYEEYGSVENCAIATECESGRLHVQPDFGFVEILLPDGRPASPGGVGEIVATGFANVNQLFIRYKTGDLAAWSDEQCPCGRTTLPVLRDLLGRQEDTVVGPDGRETVRFHGLFIGLSGVSEGQLIQETRTNFTVSVVATATYTEGDAREIRDRLIQRLGPQIELTVRVVPEIPRERNGKFRAVISRVHREAPTL